MVFFGGSFNPPTIAHYNLIKQALKEYNFDKVYFVPVNDYYKKDNLISIDLRIEMLNLLCKNESDIEVLDIEKKISSQLNAIDIFKILEAKYKGHEIVFFIGEDNYAKMNTWKEYTQLKKYNYIVFQRNDNKILNITDKNIIYMKNNENLKISSTRNKRKIKK